LAHSLIQKQQISAFKAAKAIPTGGCANGVGGFAIPKGGFANVFAAIGMGEGRSVSKKSIVPIDPQLIDYWQKRKTRYPYPTKLRGKVILPIAFSLMPCAFWITLGNPRQVLSFSSNADANWRPQSYGFSLPGTALNFEFSMVKLLDYRDRWEELVLCRLSFPTNTRRFQSPGLGW
jgi:hypothetical protein